MNTFEDGIVERALELARRALELGPAESQASVQVARILTIKKEYQAAWTLLNAAHANDRTSYYPWYLRGVIALKMNDPKRAVTQFDEAEKLAIHKYQRRQLNYQRQYIARINGDAAAEEILLKKNIQDNPDSGTLYGNYAQFLKKHKRYDEAITYWEKAISISPYQHAIEQLNKTRELKKRQ